MIAQNVENPSVVSYPTHIALQVGNLVLMFDPSLARTIGRQLAACADDADRAAAEKWRQLKRDLV